MTTAIIFDFFGVIRSEGYFASKDQQVLDYVKELRAHYKVGLLSNIVQGGLKRYFTDEELAEYFDVAAASGDIGFIKPDPKSYLWVAEKLGVAPSECIMIDDRIEWCAGAEAAGMQSIHFKSLEQLKTDLGIILTK